MYSCSQQNAISVSKLAWGYCLALITRFFDFSTRYTAEFVADRVKQADEANALPNKEQRDDPRQTAHVDLIKANNAVCLQWQVLKRYIQDAFTKELLSIKLEAAGYKHYTPAKDKKWEHTLNLIKDAKQFMEEYKAELVANKNMPNTFPADFATMASAFETERNRFMSNAQSGMEGTTTKDKAIHQVELELSKLLDAGKVIFDKEPDLLRKFTFTYLIDEVRGAEPSGVKGFIERSADGQPVAGVLVSSSGHSAISDENGRYELRMTSGTHDIAFEKEGFEPFTLKGRVVRVGVMGRYNAELQAVHQGQALEPSQEDTASYNEVRAEETTPSV